MYFTASSRLAMQPITPSSEPSWPAPAPLIRQASVRDAISGRHTPVPSDPGDGDEDAFDEEMAESTTGHEEEHGAQHNMDVDDSLGQAPPESDWDEVARDVDTTLVNEVEDEDEESSAPPMTPVEGQQDEQAILDADTTLIDEDEESESAAPIPMTPAKVKHRAVFNNYLATPGSSPFRLPRPEESVHEMSLAKPDLASTAVQTDLTALQVSLPSHNEEECRANVDTYLSQISGLTQERDGVQLNRNKLQLERDEIQEERDSFEVNLLVANEHNGTLQAEVSQSLADQYVLEERCGKLEKKVR